MTNQNTNGKKKFPPSSNLESAPNAEQFNQGLAPGSSGQATSRLADHPQWREYLHSRHILEPAIAASARVEYSDYYGQTCLVWNEKRRDGSRGARRRRFIDPPLINGRQYGKSIWFKNEKTDEPFHYVGALDDLKRAIAGAGGLLHIVEGEIDVWSLYAMGLPNTIGIYGISNIPPDIASLLDELGVSKFVYFADNDDAGMRGASRWRALLDQSGWPGQGDYRRFEGSGIPEKGDANDLLCHYFSDITAARAALKAIPRFEPNIERETADKPASPIDYDDERWAPVKEAIRSALGIEVFNRKGFSKNFRCLLPHHEDQEPSAAWNKSGFYKCFGCEVVLNAKDTADLLNIDWRSLITPQPQRVSSTHIDLDSAPGTDVETAPLAFEQVPDSWLRTSNKFYTQTATTLLHFALCACRTGPLAEGFLTDEFIAASRPFGCNLKADTIKKYFKAEVFKDDTNPFFGKVDPSDDSRIWNCKFRLRPPADIKRRLAHDIRLRVYEEKFAEQRDTVIGFEIFVEALSGSEFPKSLKSALEPLYREQKARFDSLINRCERLIAGYLADLDDLAATPLPDWAIDKPCEMTALLARAIYDADPEDRSKAEWKRLLGISKSNVSAVLKRAGILRTSYTIREAVDSQRQAKERAHDLGAKIVSVDIDGSPQRYDAAIDLPEGSVVTLQPPAKHQIVSDEKQTVIAPAKTRTDSAANIPNKRTDNMRKPGNWHKPRWDPQFVYWELVKACCLLHGYEVKLDIGIHDPRTGEVWTNPTLEDVIGLIIGESAVVTPDTS